MKLQESVARLDELIKEAQGEKDVLKLIRCRLINKLLNKETK